jgi:alpha-D-ribose 1-methylphosphonate 5-triphosphate synthase subunit PhnH
MHREIAYDEVFDAQRHYRILLDSMARPGKINLLPKTVSSPPGGINAASALVGFALLNADTCFCAIGPDRGKIAHYLSLNTSSRPAAHEQADFIFLPALQEGRELQEAKKGSLSYPEEGATVVADAEEISSMHLDDSVGLTLKGPGVDGERKVYVRGLHPAVLEMLQAQNIEFPLGIDAILTDKEDRIFCIPRSNRFSYAEE